MEKIRENPICPVGTNPRILFPTGSFCSICPPSDNNCPLQSIPNLQKKTVWACNYGWLLISQKKRTKTCTSYHQFSVWKPESSKLIDLPPLNLKPNQEINAGIIFSPPEEPRCTVLLFEYVLRYLIFYRFGDTQWSHRWFGKEIDTIGRSDARDCIISRRIAHCSGSLYAAISSPKGSKIIVIEQNRPKKFSLRSLNFRLPNFSTTATIYGSYYLLDYCGQLCAVEVAWGGIYQQDIIDVEVFKLELTGNKREWIKLKSAKDRAFFISGSISFCCPVNEPGFEGGWIYFLLAEKKRLCAFNIEHRYLAVSLPSKRLPAESENSPFWLMSEFGFCKSEAEGKITISKKEAEEEEGIATQRNNQTHGRYLSELPLDILELIAKKLYQVDYINFRSVCTTFRLVAPRINWRKASFELQCSRSLSPWLIISPKADSSTIYRFKDPHLEGLYFTKLLEPLSDAKVRYSKDGWLLLSNVNSLSIYHPLRKKTTTMALPEGSMVQNRCSGYALSSLPPSQETILVGSASFEIHYFCLGWHEFTCRDYVDFQPNHNSPIFFNEAFYLLGRDGRLGVFELRDGQASWNTLKKLKCPRPCDSFSYNYLVECDGKLLSVFVDDDQSLHVYELKNLTGAEVMVWEKVTSSGNYALFVSPQSAFSIIPNSSGMENKIYFPKFCQDGYVYYCLSTDKYYTIRKKEVLADFYNTCEYLHSTWFEPRW